jgi:hypothetical protein
MTKQSIFASCGVDLDKEENGVWVSAPMAPEIEFKVRYSGSKAFQKMFSTDMRSFQSILNKKPVKRTTAEINRLEKAQSLSAAKHGILDWKNVIGEDGKQIKFSQDKAVELFSDERLRDLLAELIDIMSAKETFTPDRDFDEVDDEDTIKEQIQGN